MMIKLYAIEIFEGNIKYKDLPFSDTIKNKIKAYLTKMVEDEEVLAELTTEEQGCNLDQIKYIHLLPLFRVFSVCGESYLLR